MLEPPLCELVLLSYEDDLVRTRAPRVHARSPLTFVPSRGLGTYYVVTCGALLRSLSVLVISSPMASEAVAAVPAATIAAAPAFVAEDCT
jgi:hypothetical protein